MDAISYVYVSWTIHGMWMIYIMFERGGPKFSNTTARALPSAQPCSSVSWEQNGYYAAQDFFCVREFIKTESATAVQRAFRLRFNIQPPTRKSICRWNHQFLILKYRLTKMSPSFCITLYNYKKLVANWNEISFLQNYYTIHCLNSFSRQVAQNVLT